MRFVLHPEPAKDGEASKLNCETPVRKVSAQAQLPSKFFNERLANPRVRCAIIGDEARPLMYRKPSGRTRSDHCRTETEVFVSRLSSGNFQKPWPSRKVVEAEELVKYMSSVPCYLQRIEKGENVQEKALNFGVIDWRRLERWTSCQKTEQKNVFSATVNMTESPSLFTNESCSYSGRSSSNSPAQRKQTSGRSSCNSPAEWKQSDELDLKSGSMNNPSSSRTSPVGRSLWNNHENFHESKHEYRTSLRAKPGSSIKEEKSKSSDQRRSNHVGRFSNKNLERSFLDHLQDISCERSKTFPTIRGDINSMEVCNRLSGKLLPQKYSHQNSVSRDILQSRLSSALFQTDKPNLGATFLSTKNGVTSTKFMSKNEEGNQISTLGNCVVKTDEQSSNQKVEDISEGRKEALPKPPFASSGLKWLNRSSSLKDISSTHQLKDTNGLDYSNDKGSCNSRDRRSPLRRILDPLLKSKYNGNSKPIASLPIHRSQEPCNNNSVSTEKESTFMNAMHGSSNASIGSSNTPVPITTQGLLQDERIGVPMRQALVKLTWKNGEPLFMFSTNDDSVLVSSLRRTNSLCKKDSGVFYTIVLAQESKKKGGIWIGQSRNRKSSLLYDVVGRMEVSCSKLSTFDSKNFEVCKEFVLVRDEQLPNQEFIHSAHSSQLAAIIVKTPYQKLNGDGENLPQENCSSFHMDGLQVEQYPEYSRTCSISAILPSGIHGFSDLGKPSTLIERWKSGGSCDCGGWDEGCSLTVLADRLRELKVIDRRPTESFPPIELFIQGGKTEKKHTFSMIAFKEGLYTVQFGSSITSLQAFAICIATLHSRNSIDSLDFSVNQKSLEDSSANQKSLEDSSYDNNLKMNSMLNNGGPTNYESHHPPFSPVSRS